MRQEYQQIEAITDLIPGDSVRDKVSGRVYLVTANFGARVTAVATADITTPNGWEVLRRNEAGSREY